MKLLTKKKVSKIFIALFVFSAEFSIGEHFGVSYKPIYTINVHYIRAHGCAGRHGFEPRQLPDTFYREVGETIILWDVFGP